jgi:hypothetical protein
MPTLMTQKPPDALPTASSDVCQTSITLRFHGVDFCLQPSDSNGEVSYKSTSSNDNGLLVSLSSFTGTFLVSQSFNGKISILARDDKHVGNESTNETFATTVEEEPNSPDIAASSKSVKEVSPGQQKLSFSKAHKKISVKRKSDNQKKRSTKNVVLKRSQAFVQEEDAANAKKPKVSSTTKRARLIDISNRDRDVNVSVSGVRETFLQCQQPTQDDELRHSSFPDLSQTMDSSSSAAVASNNDFEDVLSAKGIVQTNNRSDSVQDILDRVNSSSDSMASVKDIQGDDDDEEEVATNVDFDEQHNTSMLMMNGGEDVVRRKNTINLESRSDLVNTSSSITKGHGPPCARWGATMCRIQDDQILVYGGQSYDLEGNACIMSDVHIYNHKTAIWEKPINSRGEKRQWHSSIYVPSRKHIIAFGGETTDLVSTGNSKVILSDTLRVLDTDIMLWYPPAVTGDIPTGRSGHTSVYFPHTNEMVVFGGVRGSKWLNTLSILDISSWVWKTPKVDGMPPKPRSFHSATAVGSKMVIIGGNNKTSCFNTVHVLEAIGMNSNDDASARGKNGCEWKWSQPTIKGNLPFPRTGHSATLLEDGKTICIYGGWDPNEEDEMSGEENIFSSSFLLDTEEWTWKQGPQAQSMGSGTTAYTVQDCGPKRCGHQAVLNPENGEVFVFGGRVPGEALAGDMQKLIP